MKLFLLLFILISCKKVYIDKTNNSREVLTVQENVVAEEFEGIYRFENGGSLELSNDAAGLIDIEYAYLVFPNENGSTAVFAISGNDLSVEDGLIISKSKTMPRNKAAFFRGNLDGSPDFGKNLDDDPDYSYSYVFSISFNESGLLQVILIINQSKDDDNYLAYRALITEE